MIEWLNAFLFSDGGYSPHGFCIAWNLPVLYTHIGADLLIAVSYFAIPAIILTFLRHRRDSRLHGPAMLFVVFIAACGVSHLLSIVTMFLPWYGLQGLVKLLTGLISFATAVALWKMLPDALRIPAPEELTQALNDKDHQVDQKEAAEAEMVRSQQALADKIVELEAANKELREFAYAASHDLKSPANTLSLWLSEFARDTQGMLTPALDEELSDARQIVERMRQLVEDILAYSRIVGPQEVEPKPCNLQDITDAVLRDLASDLKAHAATVTVADMPTVQGHPPLISILLHNLVANAVKFRDPDRALEIAITAELQDGAAILSVADNGIGIAAHHHDRIFQLFNRLHHDSAYQGTGLGLALCRRAVAAHGGGIDVQSSVGEGTTFIITLPQPEDPHAAEAA